MPATTFHCHLTWHTKNRAMAVQFLGFGLKQPPHSCYQTAAQTTTTTLSLTSTTPHLWSLTAVYNGAPEIRSRWLNFRLLAQTALPPHLHYQTAAQTAITTYPSHTPHHIHNSSLQFTMVHLKSIHGSLVLWIWPKTAPSPTLALLNSSLNHSHHLVPHTYHTPFITSHHCFQRHTQN